VFSRFAIMYLPHSVGSDSICTNPICLLDLVNETFEILFPSALEVGKWVFPVFIDRQLVLSTSGFVLSYLNAALVPLVSQIQKSRG